MAIAKFILHNTVHMITSRYIVILQIAISRVKNSGFVTDLWLTKSDGLIWYFRLF